jgi:hypothetical protein
LRIALKWRRSGGSLAGNPSMIRKSGNRFSEEFMPKQAEEARIDMKRTSAALLAAVALGLGSSLAHAAPPTVTPSPGYDARLQEQRAASAAKVAEPVIPAAPVARRHKRTRAH